MRDVFYYGKKPNVHPKEKLANSLEHARELATTEHFWIVNEYNDYNGFDWDFDFEMLPDSDVWAKNHNNIWPSQHQKDGGTWLCPKVGGEYIVYRSDVEPIKRKVTHDNWIIPDNVKVSAFDFSWHPDPTSPPYIYQFGTQLDRYDGPRYITPNATQISYVLRQDKVYEGDKLPRYYIETTLEDLIEIHKDKVFWALNKDLDYSDFNFSWLPQEHQAQYIQAFGTEDNLDTQTYFVNGPTYTKNKTQINYVRDKSFFLTTKLDMFFIDRGNKDANVKFSKLQTKFPTIQKTRFLNSWIDTITRCTSKSNTDLFFVLDSSLNYDEFEFDYYPNPWQMTMLHVFGTQWGQWGTTFLVNKNTFAEDTKFLNKIEHVSAINFVKEKIAKIDTCLYDVLIIDFGNPESENVLNIIKKKAPDVNITVLKYEKSYNQTIQTYNYNSLKRKEHFVWILSSICDYSDFDLSYVCDPFAKDFVHVFPTGNQKYGDTFLLDLNIINESTRLDDLKLNFNSCQHLQRFKAPIIITKNECLVGSLRDDYKFPYAIYKTYDNVDLEENTSTEINLWNENKSILVASTGATSIIATKEVKQHIYNEIYDYPYIEKAPAILKSKPIDIVFLSNGELCADEHYEHLLKVVGNNNRVVRVDGVNGRVAAYHAALEVSNTPWAFTVFAKLKVNEAFDWSWQPDRLQKQKHYIFYATNPVNGLEYGHQAMIAYNKKLVLNNVGNGLDFTLDDEHEVVEMNSGVAHYNTDPFSTWRTAFREAIKLRHATDAISKHRLDVWLSVGKGNYGEYSMMGAKDAIEYYDEVERDINKLKYSYEWLWLKDYFKKKHN